MCWAVHARRYAARMRRIALIALLALAACGGAEDTSAAPDRIVLSTLPPTPTTTALPRMVISEGQTERYIELLAERGITTAEALATADAAREVCKGLLAGGDMLNDSIWGGIAKSADAAGGDQGMRIRIAAVAAVKAFCPDLTYRIPTGFDERS